MSLKASTIVSMLLFSVGRLVREVVNILDVGDNGSENSLDDNSCSSAFIVVIIVVVVVGVVVVVVVAEVGVDAVNAGEPLATRIFSLRTGPKSIRCEMIISTTISALSEF